MKIGKLLLLALTFSAASCTLFINQTTPITLDYVMGSCQIPAGSVAKYPSSTPVAVLADAIAWIASL